MRTVVVIPTYNEAENLPLIVAEVFEVCDDGVEILVVDDHSPDGTGELAERLAASNPRIHVLHRPGKLGLGTAYLAGFRWAIERGADFVVELDADGSHPVSSLPGLLAAAARDGVDLVIGSRWVPGGRVVGFPVHRLLLSRAGNCYIRMMLGSGVHDSTGGFRVFRRSTLQAVDLDSVDSQGYCFQVDMTRRVADAGLRVVEVPIVFVPRRHGVSKMSSRIVLEALLAVTRWGVQARLRRR